MFCCAVCTQLDSENATACVLLFDSLFAGCTFMHTDEKLTLTRPAKIQASLAGKCNYLLDTAVRFASPAAEPVCFDFCEAPRRPFKFSALTTSTRARITVSHHWHAAGGEDGHFLRCYSREEPPANQTQSGVKRLLVLRLLSICSPQRDL